MRGGGAGSSVCGEGGGGGVATKEQELENCYKQASRWSVYYIRWRSI